jgi:cyanate lyase
VTYEREDDLVARKTRLGLTNRELGNALGVAPSTVASKLCGFAPLTPEERRALNRFLDECERRLQAAAAEGGQTA